MSLAFEGQNENSCHLDPRYTDPGPDFSNLSIIRGNLLFQRWWLKNQDLPFKFYPNESSKMGGVGARRERKIYFFDKKKKRKLYRDSQEPEKNLRF